MKEELQSLIDKHRTTIRKADYADYLTSDDEIHLAKECARISINYLETYSKYFIIPKVMITHFEELKKELEKI